MQRNTKLLRVFLGLVALLVVGNAAVALWHVSNLNEHQRLVNHTLAVQSALTRIMILLNESETGQRGYILTGERGYLDPYLSASGKIQENVDAFRELTRDSPFQQANVDELERMIDVRLATMSQRLDDFNRYGYEIGAESLRQAGGRQQMIEIRRKVAEMDLHEAELMKSREARAASSYRLAVLSSAIGGMLGLGLVGLAVLRLQREVTFRYQSARILGEQREWFRTVLASIGDAVIATGSDGRVSFMNAVAEEMTGWDRDAAIGVQLERVFHIVNEGTRESVENPALIALRDGKIVELANHTVLISKDGSERAIDDSAAPIELEDGTHVGAVLIFRDVTDRRASEAERAAAFERETLARQRAEEANRLKDDFLATISHELRTPLNAILGWSAILRSENAKPDMFPRGLDTIERNARSQAQLIEDLLDASRITRGVLHLDITTVDTARVIRSAIEAVQLAADARDVKILLIVTPDAGSLIGDAHRLQQIVWNLLSNAIKFSPKGGRVEITVGRDEDGIEIAISDSGRGIDPAFLPHVFERFRQADSSSSRTHGGVGLGLAIVKQLTELHGGSISVTSEGEGKGATFTVRLPVAPTRRDAEPAVEKRSLAFPDGRSLDFEPVPLQGLRVVLVDDEEETLLVLEEILTLCEAVVRKATTVDEGIAAVREWSPDLVVSDIAMPDRDGISFIREIRSLPREQGGGVPAIALTGFARVEDRVRVLANGFQTHITKPVEPEEFLAVVKSVVGFDRQQTM